MRCCTCTPGIVASRSFCSRCTESELCPPSFVSRDGSRGEKLLARVSTLTREQRFVVSFLFSRYSGMRLANAIHGLVWNFVSLSLFCMRDAILNGMFAGFVHPRRRSVIPRWQIRQGPSWYAFKHDSRVMCDRQILFPEQLPLKWCCN